MRHRGAKIVEEAQRWPRPVGSTFTLLHVLNFFRFVNAPILLQRAKDAAQAGLVRLKELAGAGWKTEVDVTLGKPRKVICKIIYKIAASSKVDLVMLGSSHRGPVSRLLLGSTAHSVLRQSSCSVEIVRPPSNKKNVRTANMKVLIATDGSKFSELALRFVVHRPWPTGSEVKIKDLNNSALKEARTVADAGSRMLSRLEGKVSTDTPFPQGSIAGTIVKKAEEWGAQLIVLGPHGRRKFDRLMLGSVSEHVAFHGHVRSK